MNVMFFPSVQPSAWRPPANACQALSAVGSAGGATPRNATRADATSAMHGSGRLAMSRQARMAIRTRIKAPPSGTACLGVAQPSIAEFARLASPPAAAYLSAMQPLLVAERPQGDIERPFRLY